MRHEKNYEKIKFQNLTPEEQIAYVSFGCIASGEFERLSKILSDKV